MNRMQTVVVLLAIVAVLSASASFAQQPGQSPGVSPGTPKNTVPEASPVPKASSFIGSSVVNAQGESLGKIEDLVLDPASGHVTYAAMSYGSVLGFGGKLFAVPWEALKLQPDGKTFVLNVSKESLESATGFDKGNWPKQPDPMLRVSARGPGATGMGATPLTDSTAGAGMSATVQEVNAQKETVKLKTERGDSVELQAPAAALANLQVGDVVDVKMVGTRATEIRKKE